MAAASIFAGRFRLGESLGRGGMGAVFRAHDLTLGRDVALKLATGSLDAERLERWRREGQLTAGLRHPGIVTVHAAGIEQQRPWIAYELIVDATSLSAAPREWPRERRVRCVLDAARALGHAHAQGVVHRDVKPDNLLVDAEGRVRVTDFGVATAMDLEQLTRSGALVGTPSYMAPEQAAGEPVSPATDVWALGVVLYEALTGRLPFEGGSLFEVLAAILRGSVPRPRAIDASVPAALESVCLRALSLDPGRRFADGSAFADALERALTGEREAGRRRTPALLVAAALIGLGAIAAAAAWRSPAPPRVLPAPTPAPVAPAPIAADVGAAVAPLAPPSTRPRSIDEIPAIEGEVRQLVHEVLDTMVWVDVGSLENPDSGVAVTVALELRRTDPAAAARVFKWAASATAPSVRGAAWLELGRLFFEGRGVAMDARAACACYEASAATGDAFGLARLAEAQLRGTGTTRDIPAAVVGYRRALAVAPSDGDWVQDSVAVGLAEAAILRPDLVSVEELEPLLRSGATRRVGAKVWLARVLGELKGDRAAAGAVFRECIERHDLPAAYVGLALLLHPTDPDAATELLRGPARADYQIEFARCLLIEREKLPPARARALEVLRRAVAAGGTAASRANVCLRRLARQDHEKTPGAPYDLAEARAFLTDAAASDDPFLAAEAREELSWLPP